jgi:type I restriction enzyme S subunit
MMPESFNKTTFGDFVKLQRGFDLPKQDREPGDFPVVASTSIPDYHTEFKVKPPGTPARPIGLKGCAGRTSRNIR